MARCKTWVRFFVPPGSALRQAGDRTCQAGSRAVTADQFAIVPPQGQPASTAEPSTGTETHSGSELRVKHTFRGGCLSQGSFGIKRMAFVPNAVKFTGWTPLSWGTLEMSPCAPPSASLASARPICSVQLLWWRCEKAFLNYCKQNHARDEK